MNNGTLLAVKLKGRRVFQMLSSVHSVVDVEVGQITLELATQSLNLRLFMTTTSSWGQLTGVIRWWPILASTMRWWKKKFFHLFFLILNAYILYKQRAWSPVLQRTFQRELLKEFVRNSGISHSL